MSKNHNQANAETPVEALSKAEAFITKYRKVIIASTVLILVAGIGGYVWYSVEQNKRDEVRENYQEAEDLALQAVDSLGNSLAIDAFKELAETYGERRVRKAVPVAPFEQGILAYEQGQFNEAIEYFEQYKGKDELYRARTLACIGDCYINLENYSKALEYYSDAITLSDNEFASEYAFKAGLTAEKIGDSEKALSFYKKIKEQYPNTPRGMAIEKYISRVEAK